MKIIRLGVLQFHSDAVVQALLIFFAIMMQGSTTYRYEILPYESILIVPILLLLIFFRKSVPIKSVMIPVSVLGFLIIVQRYLGSGGVGISTWTQFSCRIILTYLAVYVNKQRFLTRFIKIVFVISLISLLFWSGSIVAPTFTKALLPNIYVSEFYTKIPYYSNILYSWLQDGEMRNCGMFTEPGRYQIVLNSAVYFLLFYRDKIDIKTRKKNIIMMILIVTVLTAQSTTGYLGLGIVGLFGFIELKKKNIKELIDKFGKVVILGTIFIGGEILINPKSLFKNLFENVLSSKLSSEGGLFSASSGYYRVLVMEAAVNTLKNNPFGVGYGNTANILSESIYEGAAGAVLFKDLMALGIITIGYILFWYIRPIIRYKSSWFSVLSALFLYFNTTIAQSDILYPCLIVIPIIAEMYGSTVRKEMIG